MATIEEVLQGVNKQVFPEVLGSVVNAKPKEARETEWGVKNQQWVLLKNGDKTIPVTLTDQVELKVGQDVVFRANSGAHGLTGVQLRRWQTVTGDPKVSLSVTASANVEVGAQQRVQPSLPNTAIAPQASNVGFSNQTFTKKQGSYTAAERATITDFYIDHFITKYPQFSNREGLPSLAELVKTMVTGHTLSGAEVPAVVKAEVPKATFNTPQAAPTTPNDYDFNSEGADEIPF